MSEPDLCPVLPSVGIWMNYCLIFTYLARGQWSQQVDYSSHAVWRGKGGVVVVVW